jgi:putative hydrolase of the HAD superfamily
VALRAVLFDLFGTLVSSGLWREHDAVVARMGEILQAPPEAFFEVFNVETRLDREVGRFHSLEENLAYVCRKIGVPVDEELIARAAQVRRDFVASVLVPRPDAVPTLRALDRMGLRLGLISDCSPEVPPLFTRTPLAALIQVTVFSALEGTKKPDPRMYAAACEALRVEPGQALFVGDGGSSELTGARDCGITPVLLRTPGEDFDLEHRPDAKDWQGESIARLSELPELMQRRGWLDGG